MATGTGNTHTQNLVKFCTCGFQDMRTDRQIQTYGSRSTWLLAPLVGTD